MSEKALNKENKPVIRFGGFDENWTSRALREFTHRITRKNEENQSDLPLTISAQYGLIDQRNYFNNQVAARDMSNYYLLKRGEFAYNKSTSVDNPWGAVKYLSEYDEGCVSTLYICFGLDQGNREFLNSYYETDRWYTPVQMIAAEGARNHGLLNIAADDFLDTKLTIPTDVREQEKIGKTFAALDRLILLEQKKLDDLKNTKSAMLVKMFPKKGETVPEVRFDGFNGKWEKRRLSSIFTIRNEKNGNRYSRKDVLAVSDTYGCVNQIELHGRSCAGASISNYKVIRDGDIIYTKSPLHAKPYGIIKIMDKGCGIISPLYVVNETADGIDALFMYYVFDSPEKTNNYLELLVRKGAKNTMNISDSEWLSGAVMISPDINEQKSISRYFYNLDRLITLHRRKVEKLEDAKKALLNKMFCN